MSDFTPRPRVRPATRFECVKASAAISVRTRAVFDALIVAALDPEVRSLAPADPVAVTLGGRLLQHLPDFLVGTGGPAIVVDIRSPVSADTVRARHDAVAAALTAQGIAYEVREPPLIHGGSPLLMNCRSVWGCRGVSTTATDQVRALDILRLGPAPLAEVAQALRAADGVSAILGLACRDVVVLDLASAPLGPETLVRRRTTLPS